MGILWMALIGLIIGAVAKVVMPGRDGGGIIATMILGICGALLATWLGQAAGWYAPGQGAGWLGAIIGAVIILWLFRLIRPHGTPLVR